MPIPNSGEVAKVRKDLQDLAEEVRLISLTTITDEKLETVKKQLGMLQSWIGQMPLRYAELLVAVENERKRTNG